MGALRGNHVKFWFVALLSVVVLWGHSLADPRLGRKGHSHDTTTADAKSWRGIAAASGGNAPLFVSRWPAVGATHRTSKFAGSILSNGIIGGFKDHITGEWRPGFEFPANSGIEYLGSANIWVGGIVGQDTLVSAGSTWDGGAGLITHWGREFYPLYDPWDGKGTTPTSLGLGSAFQAHYADTFTANVRYLNNRDFFGDRPHIPMNLSVIQKSYSLDVNPYRNIMLLDFIITNIGSDPIEKAYVGIVVDGYVCRETDEYTGCDEDDLTGSLRGISTGYIIDNDGDPHSGLFRDSLSPIDAIALRPVMIYPPVTDTNYNWWFIGPWKGDWYDFGPRLKGTALAPFRDFQTSGIGSPNGDVNKYYVLSHREWDHDQVMTATIDSTDSQWLYPNQSLTWEISNGYETRFLLSVGPIDLMPDSSMRAIFALFGGDFVHVDPSNRDNLLGGNYRTYYNNLHFDILRETAEDAVSFAYYVVDPMRPPTGLNVIKMSADTAVLSWDQWVFPEVTGCNVYLKPVDDAYLIAPQVVTPGVAPIDMGNNVYHFPAGSKRGTITGLRAGKLYFAAIARVTESDEGELSKPVVVGYNNAALQVESLPFTREYTFFQEGDSAVTLTWAASEDPSVRYYKIYKTLDTLVAKDRYYPFLTDDSSLVPYVPKACRKGDSVTYCYYEMEPYDSTASNIASYTDHDPVEGAIYWVSAVANWGYQSPYSGLITTEKTVNPTKEIVVVLGESGTATDYVFADSLIAYYGRLLSGYEFDIYNWADTNLGSLNCPSGYCTDWLDLARYEVVIVEEFPSPKILSRVTEPVHKLLTRVLDSGRDLVYFGIPPGDEQINLSSYVDTILYDSSSFEARYFNLESTFLKSWMRNYDAFDAVDSLAGFNGAVPVENELPQLPLDTANNRLKPLISQLFSIGNVLPLTPAFSPTQQAEILYLYNSRYPNTSELQGMPCGVLSQHESSKAYIFSFHLWAMEETTARQLIDYIMEHRADDDPNDNPPLLPESVCLYQNYPNPFNATTKILFDLPRESRVTLEIYNILGQRVHTLLDETKSAGSYTIEWNSRDNSGRTVASGIYFYLLKTEDETVTKKMVLLK